MRRGILGRVTTRSRLLAAALLAAALAGPAAARAADVPPGGIPDLVGPRGLALGASIGLAAGNEGIFVNPAALAARKRYSVEALGLVERRGAEAVGEYAGGSVVDSTSSPVTAAVAYTRAAKGAYEGNVWDLAFAGAVAPGLYVGVTGKYLSVQSATDKVSAPTLDAGIFWQAADLLSIGAAGYDLVPADHDLVAPMGWGVGVAVGNDQALQVTADWRSDSGRGTSKTTNRYAVGAEALLGSMFPVRVGWMRDETLDTSWWSAGLGIVSRQGVALEAGYRQSIEDPTARAIAVSLKMFLFQ